MSDQPQLAMPGTGRQKGKKLRTAQLKGEQLVVHGVQVSAGFSAREKSLYSQETYPSEEDIGTDAYRCGTEHD